MTGDRNTWMGLDSPDRSPGEWHVGILGAPYDGSVSGAAGAREAPALLRALAARAWPHTENLISLTGLHLRDFGDAPVEQADAAATQASISTATAALVETGAIPLVLGGDHSITAGVVRALGQYKSLGIIWFDSHPDLMDSYGGRRGVEESKWNHACPLRRILELWNVRPEHLLLIGIRDFIPDELTFIRRNDIETIWAKDLHRLPHEELADRIGRKFAGLPVYVSFDINVLDPAHAPGTGVPIPGGLTTRYLYDLIFELTRRERESLADGAGHFLEVAGFDVVEIAPPLDVNGMTALAGFGVITGMLGYLCAQLGVLSDP